MLSGFAAGLNISFGAVAPAIAGSLTGGLALLNYGQVAGSKVREPWGS